MMDGQQELLLELIKRIERVKVLVDEVINNSRQLGEILNQFHKEIIELESLEYVDVHSELEVLAT
jgi:coenzyme F420-reducing hydrogenase delta subunit